LGRLLEVQLGSESGDAFLFFFNRWLFLFRKRFIILEDIKSEALFLFQNSIYKIFMTFGSIHIVKLLAASSSR